MIAKVPYIIYTLPQSRITQSLKGGNIEKTWLIFKNFLTNCTNADFKKPYSIELYGYTADEDHGEYPELANEILKKTENVFGNGITETLGYHYPSNIPLKQTKTNWILNSDDLNKAIKLMVELQPQPKYNLGPVELILSYDFKLIDLDTKIELPNQQFTSMMLIWLSRNNYVSPKLCFPFAEPDKNFWSYIESIEKYFPFKFDKKYLRIVHSNKKGTANIFSKF